MSLVFCSNFTEASTGTIDQTPRTEAEYHALTDTTSELFWLRWFLKDLGVSTSSTTPLYCDNQSAIHVAHNDVFYE